MTTATAEPETQVSPILVLKELQAMRRAVLRAQIRIINASRAQARRCLGWRLDMPAKEQVKINVKAAKLVQAIEKGEPCPEGMESAAENIGLFVLASKAAREPFDVQRKAIEKQMTALATALPVWDEWGENVEGFGPISLSIIVGEAGDLGMYANPAKLWKRMGLAVFDGKSQRKTTDKVSAIEQGYSPRRRSSMFVIGEALIWVANGGGYYKHVYDERRQYELERNPEEFDKGIDAKTGKQRVSMHCHRRAHRYMEKRLLRDLWKAWRRGHGQSDTQDTAAPSP